MSISKEYHVLYLLFNDWYLFIIFGISWRSFLWGLFEPYRIRWRCAIYGGGASLGAGSTTIFGAGCEDVRGCGCGGGGGGGGGGNGDGGVK